MPPDPKPRRRFVARDPRDRYEAFGHVRKRGAQCIICGAQGDLTAHHIVPRSQGGDDWRINIVPIHHSGHMAAHAGHEDVLAAIWQGLEEEQREYARERFGHGRAETYYRVGRGRPPSEPAPCPVRFGG